MKSVVERPEIDLNQSMDLNRPIDFPSSPSPQVHSFMPDMPPFMLPDQCHHENEKVAEEDSCLMQVHKKFLELFWRQQMFEIYNTPVFKSHHQLPFSRIKKIMKSDREVKMVSADTPIVFSKACELFILELTVRAWLQTEKCRRRTIQPFDIARAVRLDDHLDFLVDVAPLNQEHYNKEEGSEKESEQTESLTAESLNLPMMTNVGELFMTNPELSGPYMFAPSMSCAELENDPRSK
ncbi:nuclear transcription factor Y subunit C-10-like [Castanea sativa]|uniref:nuclear transcription factor Y subunit C-10-like n=1 Tax=Castanea sativa TaxID=21020 RepID=UPI003F64AA59